MRWVPADPAHAFAPIPRIGRRSGWQWGDRLWDLRGWMNLTIGGVGTRRGRPHPVELASGDTIDVWRVEEMVREPRLRLVAETKLPGITWLEFEVTPRGAGSEIRQTASFAPSALLGRLYWCSVALFHQVLLRRVLERIAAAVPPPNAELTDGPSAR